MQARPLLAAEGKGQTPNAESHGITLDWCGKSTAIERRGEPGPDRPRSGR